jgi:hypothetical protein
MSCSGVWFAGGKFGVSWVMKQMIVWKPNRITGYSFLEDSDDEFEVSQNNSKGTSNNFVNSSDDESEHEDVTENLSVQEQEEEEEEEEMVEAPKPKKKRVTRKRKKKKSDENDEVSVSSNV